MGARAGGYRLIRRIRAGGMAEVYLARSPRGDDVAIKRLLPALEGDPRFAGSLREEALVAARVRHEHVVRVHGYGRDGGRGFLIMEYIDGKNLAELRGRDRGSPVAPPLAVALSLIRQAASAVAATHAAGIIHGDVSPANLLVTLGDAAGEGAGIVKLCDFGLARDERNPSAHPRAGSAAYLAPERADGAVGDRRADVFSLGVCAWELLSGRRLFAAGTTMETLDRVRTRRAGVPAVLAREPALAALLAAALEPDPERRLPSARAIAEQTAAPLASRAATRDELHAWLDVIGAREPPGPGAIDPTTTEVMA